MTFATAQDAFDAMEVSGADWLAKRELRQEGSTRAAYWRSA